METVTYQALRRLAKQCTNAKKTAAVLGDCATQQFAAALCGESVRRGFPLHVFDADYDQMEALLLDPDSALYRAKPDFILIFACTEKLRLRFFRTPPAERITFAEHEADRFAALWEAAHRSCGAKLLMFDFPDAGDDVFGSFALRTPASFAYQQRQLNLLLGSRMASDYPYVYPVALSDVQRELGREAFFDERMWYLAKMPMTTAALPLAAARVLDTVTALAGIIKKCVICDLDNTLWGGIIGDDGMNGIRLGDLGDGPAFAALQTWLLELRRRGILLAVCSKNDEAVAKEPFEHHPEMVLRLEDIACFVANWDNKADNIRRIRDTLGLGLDSFVFLDDNPFERGVVREMLPDVTVPELPEDPAAVPGFLRGLHLFEAVSFSEEDAARTAQYQAEASRTAAQARYTDFGDFLRDLGMQAEILPFDAFHYPRIAQLTQRSNQFNLRTVRYTESEIAAIAQSPEYITRYMTLADRFGEHGLISLVILKKQEDALFIDTWLMSYRVLRRGVEDCLFNEVVRIAREAGFRRLIGEYIPTAKNKMVADFYAGYGMRETAPNRFELDTEAYQPREHLITVLAAKKL